MVALDFCCLDCAWPSGCNRITKSCILTGDAPTGSCCLKILSFGCSPTEIKPQELTTLMPWLASLTFPGWILMRMGLPCGPGPAQVLQSISSFVSWAGIDHPDFHF